MDCTCLDCIRRFNRQSAFYFESDPESEDDTDLSTLQSRSEFDEQFDIPSQRESQQEADYEFAFQLHLDEVAEATKNPQPEIKMPELTDTGYYPNYEPFDCPICLVKCETADGVLLRNCCHTFCKECIANVVKHSDEAEIKCPFLDGNEKCDNVITDREIRALVSPEQYEKYLQQSLRVAESCANSFHCRTPNCKGFCFFEQGVNEFVCPVCRAENCLICRAIHAGYNCKQYQSSIHLDTGSVATNCVLAEMIKNGEAMKCPNCQIAIMKRGGCDGIYCSMCKTDICWATRGPRWGPRGKGDTSGGCRCRFNSIKCHPLCQNCH